MDRGKLLTFVWDSSPFMIGGVTRDREGDKKNEIKRKGESPRDQR